MRTRRHEFDELVRKLEALGHRSPHAYRFRVAMLGLAGYGYIAMVLVLLVGATLAYPLLIFLTAPAIFYLLKSLWIIIQPPSGIPLKREQAPKLFDKLQEIRERLGCPRFHGVLVTDDFNAFAAQVPRLGVLGWHKNYVLVGLPYMMAFTPEQFTAVLAHEMAHIFGADGRFGGWIYRVEATWHNLNHHMGEGKLVGAWSLLRPFFRRYSPYFSAHAFVLGRANEYAADQFAARMTSTRHTAEDLIVGEIRGAQLGLEFWAAIWKPAADRQEIEETPYRKMRDALREPIPEEKARVWLQRALNRLTNTADTHPSLSDRLRALGEPAVIPAPAERTAAEHFLGDTVEGLLTQLDQDWRVNASPHWTERHNHVIEVRKQRAELEEKLKGAETPAVADLWTLAAQTEDVDGSAAALPHYRKCLAADANHADATFAVGRILVDQWDDAGVELLERASKLESNFTFAATDTLFGYFMAKGQHARAQDYYERAIRQNERIDLANEERSRATARDQYLPHALSQKDLDDLVAQLSGYSEIARVYLVRKNVQYFPEKPMYVLGYVMCFLDARDAPNFIQQIVGQVKTSGYTLFFDVSNDYIMKSALKKVPGSLIWRQRKFPRLRAALGLEA